MNALERLPQRDLATITGGPDTLILCPNARLAGAVRQAHGEIQIRRGASTWQAINGATPAQWLDHLCSAALLRGEIPAAAVPGQFLTWPQERCLWERALAEDPHLESALFDREGMAQAAMDADSLMQRWRVEVPESWQTDEFRAFLRWQAGVAEMAKSNDWTTAAKAMDWRLAALARGVSGLPRCIGLAGFVSLDPLMLQLLEILRERDVDIVCVVLASEQRAEQRTAPAQVPCADAEAEHRAAAQWVLDALAVNPQARLRIAAADWATRRPALEAVLDAALHPEAIGAGWASSEKRWQAVSGSPLSEQFLVSTALRLLQLAVRPRNVMLSEFGDLLCAGGWSADSHEADARARLDAALRERLGPETTLERLRRLIPKRGLPSVAAADFSSLGLSQLQAHLDGLSNSLRQQAARQTPGKWGECFVAGLQAAGWPGERRLRPDEHAACSALRELCAGLLSLDAVVGRIDAQSALRLLRQLVREQSFVPLRSSRPAVEIGSLDEVLGAPVDGLWIMGMNEGAWPPAARPNALLPARQQRLAGIPAARPDLLADQAAQWQALWCLQATEVNFSWAQREGERVLRPSPLLAAYPLRQGAAQFASLQGMSEPAAMLESLSDALAPPMDEVERQRLRGGTGLLQAQAICPAWGFYQYRLGAVPLAEPVLGLDARIRGGLLHSALEAFWRGRGLADLLALSEEARTVGVTNAVVQALAEYQRDLPEPLSARLLTLERERLTALLETWLAVEAKRADFQVQACEEHHTLDIAGLPVHVVVDRVDRLADGQLVVIDYKSGRSVSADSWADVRMVEPQLPIYAALAFPDSDVAAVALARVVGDEPGFVGVAESEALLPGLRTLEAQRRRYPAADFPDWPALRRCWAQRIEALAREIVAGQAGVIFEDEKNLAYCPVKPVLRLAESSAMALPEEDAR